MRKSENSVLQRLLQNRIAVAAGAVFLLIVFACIFAPLLTPYSYMGLDLQRILEGPSHDHIIGTDGLGRDLLSRMLYGGRVTLRIAGIAVLIAWLGILPGLLCGYRGGAADAVFSRIFDAVSVLPPLLLIVFSEALFGYGKGYYQYALGVAFMPQLFRLTRTLTMEMSGREYIEAAAALGVRSGKILVSHILRNILPELLTQMVSTFSDILMYTTICGYLDIGVNPPTPEWGNIVREMFSYILSKPILIIVTSACISVTILSVNLFGRGLRDAFAADRRVN